MGRPKEEKKFQRWARFTAEELADIKAAAEADGRPVSAYIRHATLEYTRQNFELGQDEQE
jgi:hypothetical protein